MNVIGSLYDTLFDFEAPKNSGPYPIHKSLMLEAEQKDLVDWLMAHQLFRADTSILDAGCGTGNTLFKLHEKFGITGTGISLSEREVAYAKNHAEQLGIDHLRFQHQSYDEPLDGTFDHIIAIESLKHAEDLKHTLTNLTGALVTGGSLIIAEDFLVTSSRISLAHQRKWHTPAFTTLTTFLELLEAVGFESIQKYDMTDRMTWKNRYILSLLTTILPQVRRVTRGNLRQQLDIYQGALLLERMYSLGEAAYCIIIANKK